VVDGVDAVVVAEAAAAVIATGANAPKLQHYNVAKLPCNFCNLVTL
jgi:hypothetical protein